MLCYGFSYQSNLEPCCQTIVISSDEELVALVFTNLCSYVVLLCVAGVPRLAYGLSQLQKSMGLLVMSTRPGKIVSVELLKAGYVLPI